MVGIIQLIKKIRNDIVDATCADLPLTLVVDGLKKGIGGFGCRNFAKFRSSSHQIIFLVGWSVELRVKRILRKHMTHFYSSHFFKESLLKECIMHLRLI